MPLGVTIHPSSVAGWGTHATTAADDLAPLPPALSATVATLEESGGTALAGSWALTAILAAAAAASSDARARMRTCAAKLTTTAATYATTDATLAREINATLPGEPPRCR